MAAAKHVWFDNGTDMKVYALVVSENDDGTLNLITFPTSSAVEHENNIPKGDGGRTWSAA